ncbi:hypothetical protein BKA70DRAFT_129779 [Coprinopsis sp. MPI-PUGE-AT-0042]|nr:hypothetical protein BKA70DRAFT_129779 [Coprinopsis sp. MPI-PUGE-AT-0042]
MSLGVCSFCFVLRLPAEATWSGTTEPEFSPAPPSASVDTGGQQENTLTLRRLRNGDEVEGCHNRHCLNQLGCNSNMGSVARLDSRGLCYFSGRKRIWNCLCYVLSLYSHFGAGSLTMYTSAVVFLCAAIYLVLLQEESSGKSRPGDVEHEDFGLQVGATFMTSGLVISFAV